MKNRLYAMIIIISFLISISPLISSKASEEGTRAAHSPISVNGNSELALLISSEGWAGGGTSFDPYIIEDLKIDAEGYDYGIALVNTNKYVEIRNCAVNNANYRGSGNNINLINCNYIFIKECYFTDSINSNIIVQDSDFFSITDNTIVGSDEGRGIEIDGSSTFTLSGNTIRRNYEDGILLDNCNNFLIKSNTIDENEMNGIHLYNSYHGNITENHVKDNLEQGIDIDYGSNDLRISMNEFINNSIDIYWGIDDNVISRDNTVNGRPIYQYVDMDMTGIKAPSDAGMILGQNISGLEISDFEIDFASNFVLIHKSDNITVSDVTISNAGTCLEFNSVDDLIVKDCHLSNSLSGIYPAYCDPIIVSNVTMENLTYGISTYANWGADFSNITINDTETGIALNNDFDTTVKCNEISNFRSNGIAATYSRRPRIENNIIHGKNSGMENGTRFRGCENGYFTGNVIDSSNMGIVFENSTNFVISENIVRNSGVDGLVLHYSEDMRVNGNMFFDSNGYGAILTETVNSEIFGNTFISNSMSTSTYNPLHAQAFDGGTSNVWHKHSKGNHWSDWTTPDSNYDGIVDTPYSIRGGDNFDLYPLTGTTVEYLSEPLGLEVVPGNGNATLSWDDPEINLDDSIAQFSLYRKVHNETMEVMISIPGDDNEYTDTGLTNGIQYDYRMTARNMYGEGKESSIVSVIPDGTPPNISIVIPLKGLVTNTTIYTVEWTGIDDLGDVTFEWKLGESNWTSADQNLSVDLINLTEGYHIFHLAGIDDVGNRIEINETLLVDLTNPTAWFTNKDDWMITNSTSVFVEVEWTETYQVNDLMLVLDGETVDIPNMRNTTLRNLSDREHEIGIWIVDQAGNWNLTETTFVVDTTPPEVIITRPSQGLNTVNMTINASWTIVETGAGPDLVQVRLDDGEWITETSGSYLLENLTPGIHSFSVRCYDLAGNMGDGTVSFEIFSEGDPTVPTSIITGYIVDESGDPVSGVSVISDDGNETETDSNGMFQIEVESGLRTLTFSKDGFEDFTRNLDANDDVTLEDGDIVLEEKDKDKDKESNFWRNMCICLCIVPLGIVLIGMLIGFVRRGRDRKDRYHEE